MDFSGDTLSPPMRQPVERREDSHAVTWDGDCALPEELCGLLGDRVAEAAAVARRYPVAISRYWLKHCTSAPDNPFSQQALPDAHELDPPPPGDSCDPFSELCDASPLPGAVRRFRDRILIVATNACAMRCRHCTRKNLLGEHAVPGAQDYRAIARYIEERPEIREVLLSGGDPLMLGLDELKERIATFVLLPQIYSVRIGTRVPCTDPERVTPQLAEMLGSSRKVWVNTQFNHPAEITEEASRACELLVDAGIPVSCQTVLLKGVNDDPSILEALFRKLQAIRVRPYYAFAGDPVCGTAHLRVSPKEAAALEAEVAKRLGGLALPRFVADRPGAQRKLPVGDFA